VVERQAPAGQRLQSGMSTVVVGVERAPTPVRAHACGTRKPRRGPERALSYIRFEPEYRLAPQVKRGLAYYTQDGFEITSPRLGAQQQLLGGGGYDRGIGFAIGVDRLVLAAQAAETVPLR